MKNKRKTLEDLFGDVTGKSDNFVINQDKKGNVRVKRNGKYLDENPKAEIYLNETELKKAAMENVLELLKNCKILYTDNMALRVGDGKKVKSRNPGMSDHHLCIRGLFVAIEAKMPGKDLSDNQDKYKKAVLAANGIFIMYHSVFELETELLKYKLISRRMF